MTTSPPSWTLEEFTEGAERGIRDFRDGRLSEEASLYSTYYERALGEIEELLELTDDLRRPLADAQGAVTEYLEVLRYVAAPPISDDDVLTLSDISRRQLYTKPGSEAVVRTVMAVADRHRFPWLVTGHEPTDAERAAAAMATAVAVSASKVLTYRRNDSKRLQEELVKQKLVAAGFVELPRKTISTARDFPPAGHFYPETRVGEDKADIVVGLWDDRVLCIECKVSNSTINSYKRIKGDAAAKAGRWLQKFGTAMIVPAAVISGVYRPANLLEAQRAGLTVWWAHDINTMMDWVESTRP